VAQERVERRLAAILAADVVGYSRLVGMDEEGTIARLKALREELIDPSFAKHRGRIVKTMGDGILVEFPSVVDAVRNAVEVQRAMAERNADEPEDQRIEFRVGVNLGDIIIDGDDILGDGVNIAARLEGLAKPGSICISGDVFRQVEGKLDLGFEDLGEQRVKNIAQPVRTYRVDLGPPAPPSEEAKPARPLAERPSIAVLPFDNLSGDPEQEYFADGIAEDIITALSRFHWFLVVARNSSFTYKGRAVDVRTVGRELGVRYVLEGSVRRGGDRLRITAQLVEAETGNHLWAERYDGALEDVFDLQDRITEGVVGAVEPSVRLAEIERARRKRPDSLDAYDLYLRALPHAWVYTEAESEKAIELLEAALRIDPEYVAAHGLAAWCNARFAWLDPDDPRRSIAVQHARAVLGPNTDDSLALAFAGFAYAYFERDYDVALDAVRRALASTPNSPMVLSLAALVHAFAGRFDAAIEHAEASLRLSPFDPMRFSAELAAAYGHFFSECYDDAAEAAQRSAHINPHLVPAIALVVASRTRGGQPQAAHAAAERLLGLVPEFRVGDFVRVGRFAPELNEKYGAALREAGLPE
jgi:TolB-like protein/Tfp pilus assembly protein PilF